MNCAIPSGSNWTVLDPRDTAHTEGATERMNPSAEACCMIEGWDPKHLWKRVCMQAAREAHFAWSLTDTPELVHWSELECCNLQGVCTFLLPRALTRTHNKIEVACIHESIFTSISTQFFNYYNWANPIICIWTRNVNVWTTSFSAQTILGFVHVNSIINFVNSMVLGGCVPLSFIGVF